MTGVDGGSTTNFTSGNIVGVNTGATAIAGLNVAKLRAGRKILMQNEVDFDSDPLFAAVNPMRPREAFGIATSAPRFDVKTSTVLVKSMVRPRPSVIRPSSNTWRNASRTSRCAFSISSSRMT